MTKASFCVIIATSFLGVIGVDDYYLALRTFILYNMNYLMHDKMEFPNISFDFKEKEARDEILELVNQELRMNTLSFKLSDLEEIIDGVFNPNLDNPVVEIIDYKRFFRNLNELMSMKLDPFERQNLLKFIWLRMTPDDFKRPEDFLEKNVNILKDNTFNDYLKEQSINVPFLKDYKVTALTYNTYYFNESMNDMSFTIYSDEVGVKLPVVRYGIYERNGEKICEIGSIQHMSTNYYDSKMIQLEKKVDRLKYKLNKDVSEYYKYKVEPKSLISLLLFVDMLKGKGINKVVVPAMYPLDSSYHEKRVECYKTFLRGRWTKETVKIQNAKFRQEFKLLDKIDRIDEISASKTNNLIRLFERLLYHLEDSTITNYPGEVSSYFEFDLNTNNIKGEYVKSLIK